MQHADNNYRQINPDRLLGGVDYCLGCGPIFQSKAAFFRSNRVGMARLGGFDPEIPVQNGSRQLDPRVPGPSAAFLQINKTFVNGRLQEWPNAGPL